MAVRSVTLPSFGCSFAQCDSHPGFGGIMAAANPAMPAAQSRRGYRRGDGFICNRPQEVIRATATVGTCGPREAWKRPTRTRPTRSNSAIAGSTASVQARNNVQADRVGAARLSDVHTSLWRYLDPCHQQAVMRFKQRRLNSSQSSRVDPTPCSYPASFTPRGMVGDSRRCSWGRS